MIMCEDARGYGGGWSFIGIAIFLLILFAVFAGRRGCLGGGDDCAPNWRTGIGPADFSAVNAFANAVPQPQVEIMKQQAIDTGMMVREINLGNQATRAQIAETAHNAEIGALRDQLNKERMENLEYRVNANTDAKMNSLSAQVASGF